MRGTALITAAGSTRTSVASSARAMVSSSASGVRRRLLFANDVTGSHPRDQKLAIHAAKARNTRSSAMEETVRKISPDDINPRYNWGRALPALGTMGVDFEERVDYRRLHRYRLSRVRQALEKSDLGALLVFDVNNIRYITSTKNGEWERDKLCRWALLTKGSNDPILWDFGSAAVHHKLYTPWLKPENCKAGIIGMRGMVDPAFGLM